MQQIIVIGAGIGGLTTAAALAKAGQRVLVLEAHIYPGGCAGTFYYQGYRFDAGATLLAGFYPGGPMDLVAQATGVHPWPVRPSYHVMNVHLPEGPPVERWSDEARWTARREAFGDESLAFWRWQETVADLVWELGLQLPPWPPTNIRSLRDLGVIGLKWLALHSPADLAQLMRSILRPVSAQLGQASTRLRKFIDAQLLISAQTTSDRANSLYAAAALDMPRRGAVQVEGGAGAIASALAAAAEAHGARVQYRQRVHRVQQTNAGYVVHTQKESFRADQVIFNLTPPDIYRVLDADIRTSIGSTPKAPKDAWGAYMLYLGVDHNAVKGLEPNHHQIVGPGSLSEAGSVFVSISPEWDTGRAPTGRRAVTLSTHTHLEPWWQLHQNDPGAFQARKIEYQERLLNLVEQAFPGLPQSADLFLPATPLSFSRFTGRTTGWVGGVPQTHLLRARSPRLGPRLWMVGDSIFPGQSVAATALGGLRVAQDVLRPISLGLETDRTLRAVKTPG